MMGNRKSKEVSKKDSRLYEVEKMGNVQNVFTLVMLNSGLFLLVQTKKGNWGLAGGIVDQEDVSAWQAVCREWKEEVKSKLPYIVGDFFGSTNSPPLKFHWTHHDGSISGFYCGKTQSSFEELAHKFKPCHEIIAIQSVSIVELWQMVNGKHSTMKLRPCAIKSTRTLLNALGFC
jgi:hypothetical protein